MILGVNRLELVKERITCRIICALVSWIWFDVSIVNIEISILMQWIDPMIPIEIAKNEFILLLNSILFYSLLRIILLSISSRVLVRNQSSYSKPWLNSKSIIVRKVL